MPLATTIAARMSVATAMRSVQRPGEGDVGLRAGEAAGEGDGGEDARGPGDAAVEPPAGVEQQNHQHEHAEVDVRLQPLLERPEPRAIPALADAEERLEENQRE